MIEHEFGVPIPGSIRPQAEWTRTAFKSFPPDGFLNWKEIFGRDASVVLDIGCGNGRFTLLSALSRPDVDHFASDLLPVVIRYATRRANQRGLSNVRFGVKDGQTLLRRYVEPSSVAEIHVYHPQPFRDPRQVRLRLITPRFLADAHRSLSAGGILVVQTDNPEYWEYINNVVPHFFEFQPHPEAWPDAPEGRSRREILSRSRGLTIFRAVCSRRDALDPDERERLANELPLPRFRTSGPSIDLDDADGEIREGTRGRRRKPRGGV